MVGCRCQSISPQSVRAIGRTRRGRPARRGAYLHIRTSAAAQRPDPAPPNDRRHRRHTRPLHPTALRPEFTHQVRPHDDRGGRRLDRLQARQWWRSGRGCPTWQARIGVRTQYTHTHRYASRNCGDLAAPSLRTSPACRCAADATRPKIRDLPLPFSADLTLQCPHWIKLIFEIGRVVSQSFGVGECERGMARDDPKSVETSRYPFRNAQEPRRSHRTGRCLQRLQKSPGLEIRTYHRSCAAYGARRVLADAASATTNPSEQSP